jgi:phosphatidylglycerol:prolipoprotein diacylglycerol transferase
MGLAWGVAYFFTQNLFLKNDEDSSGIFFLYLGVFISSWLGAKVFFLIFSAEEKIAQYLHADYFWLGGGFVFYGGLIFGLIYYLIYSLLLKKSNFEKSYLLIPGLIFGHAIGRVGCFFTGCCYGSQCNLPWAIKTEGVFRHPVQLYEAVALFLLGYLSLRWIRYKQSNVNVLLNYLLSYSLLRFILEFFRGDQIRGIYWLSISTSQLISISLFCISIIIKIKKQKK